MSDGEWIYLDLRGRNCGSHKGPTAFAAVLIAEAVFPCSRCPHPDHWLISADEVFPDQCHTLFKGQSTT